MTSQELIKDGWFKEREVLWPGQGMTIAVEKVITEFRSNFQDILVFDSKTYGRVMVLDGVIQVTERDEYSYQEMLTHLPLFAHKNPKSVCIIGGGDGGVLREVCKHKSVENIVMCEIDPSVCEVSKKYFADSMATAFGDKRVTLLHEDGAAFLENTNVKFDVIITDSSDPVGPAETLFENSFFGKVSRALNDDGIFINQGECMWLHLKLISQVLESCGQFFPVVSYAYTTIPTYPSGQIGFVVCSKGATVDPTTPKRKVPHDMKLKYYNGKLHGAAFVLPQFAEEQVAPNRKLPSSNMFNLNMSALDDTAIRTLLISSTVACLVGFALGKSF